MSSSDEGPHLSAEDPLLPRVRELVRERLGVEPASLEPLHQGMALRRFYRVRLPAGVRPASAVARLEAPEDPARRPAGLPPEPALEPLRSFLEAAGLPVPALLARDAQAGIELLEDLGSRSLADAVADASASEREALYTEACALVPRLQAVQDPGGALPAFQRRLDRPFFDYKAAFFVRWSLPQALGRAARPAEAAVVQEAFDVVAEAAAGAPARLSHRDLQSANLLLRPGAPPGARLVLIDLQGAWLAPPEYDLVCLLRDSYVELAPGEQRAHLARVRPLLPDAPPADVFLRRFDLLTLTRKGKDHAVFLYHASRGDGHWLRFVPTTVRHLRAAAVALADTDRRLARLAELVLELPEQPCAR